MWSKTIIWGNHRLSGGMLNPTANAYTVGTTWGVSATDHGDNIVWDTACPTGCDNIVWGMGGGDNIVWGTGGGDNIVWGAGGGDNIVWGTDGDGGNRKAGGRSLHVIAIVAATVSLDGRADLHHSPRNHRRSSRSSGARTRHASSGRGRELVLFPVQRFR